MNNRHVLNVRFTFPIFLICQSNGEFLSGCLTVDLDEPRLAFALVKILEITPLLRNTLPQKTYMRLRKVMRYRQDYVTLFA